MSKYLQSLFKAAFLSRIQHTIQNIKSRLGLRNHWWLHLTDLTDELDNNLAKSMYIADDT